MKWLVNLNNFSHQQSGDFLTNHTSYCKWVEIGNKRWTEAEIFDYLFTGPLLTVCIIFGFFGNLVCTFTFAKFLPKLEIYRHLLTLSVWDLFHVTAAFFLYNLPTLIYDEFVHFGAHVVASPFSYYVAQATRVGSIWTVILLAVHKYMALCHPFYFQRASISKVWWNSARLTPLMIIVCAFLYALPRFFEMTVDYCLEVTTNTEIPFTVYKLRESNIYWLLYRVIGGGILYSFVPFIALLWLTCRLWLEIRRLNPQTKIPRSDKVQRTADEKRPSTTSKFQNRSVSVSLSNTTLADEKVFCSSTPLANDRSVQFAVNDENLTTAMMKNSLSNDGTRSSGKYGRSSFQNQQNIPLVHCENSTTVKSVRSRRASPNQCSNSDHSSIVIEKMNHSMHVIVITKFLACHLFPTIMDILEWGRLDKRNQENVWIVMAHFVIFLAVFNGSCNFIIYYATSATFRLDFKHAFCGKWLRKNSNGQYA